MECLLDNWTVRDAVAAQKRYQRRTGAAGAATPERQPFSNLGRKGRAFIRDQDHEVRVGGFARGEQAELWAAEQFGVPGCLGAIRPIEFALQTLRSPAGERRPAPVRIDLHDS